MFVLKNTTMLSNDTQNLIPTKASLIKQSNDFKTVVFESKKKKINSNSITKKNKDEISKNDEPDLKKMRHEIMNFGMKGLNTKDRTDARKQLCIKLGAKPPKRVYENYKELLEKKSKLKDNATEDDEKLKFGSAASFKNPYKNNLRRKRKDTGILENYGVVKNKKKAQSKKGLK